MRPKNEAAEGAANAFGRVIDRNPNASTVALGGEPRPSAVQLGVILLLVIDELRAELRAGMARPVPAEGKR